MNLNCGLQQYVNSIVHFESFVMLKVKESQLQLLLNIQSL